MIPFYLVDQVKDASVVHSGQAARQSRIPKRSKVLFNCNSDIIEVKAFVSYHENAIYGVTRFFFFNKVYRVCLCCTSVYKVSSPWQQDHLPALKATKNFPLFLHRRQKTDKSSAPVVLQKTDSFIFSHPPKNQKPSERFQIKTPW